MKNEKLFLVLIIIISILLEISHIQIKAIYSQSQKDSAQISSLQDKVMKLEAEQNKTLKTVSSALDNFQNRIWQVEDNIKLQNQFMNLEWDKWQDYYIKHWKKVIP